MAEVRLRIEDLVRALQAPGGPNWIHTLSKQCTPFGLAFDDFKAPNLAIRAWHRDLQTFVGVLVGVDDNRIFWKTRCPKCGIDANCEHGRAAMAMVSSVAPMLAYQTRGRESLASYRHPILSNVSAGLPPDRRDDLELLRKADLFGKRLPDFIEPPPFELTYWIDRVAEAERQVAQAEQEDDEPVQRTANIPQEAQLRFLLLSPALGELSIRTVYQTAEEVRSAPRLIDIDGDDTARRRTIIQRLTQQEMAWLLQIRSWERTHLAATYRIRSAHQQALLRELIEAGRVQMGDETGDPVRIAEPAKLDLSWAVVGDSNLMASLKPALTPPGEVLSLPELWVFDAPAAAIHPLPGVSPGLLQALKTAPAISRQHIPAFRQSLEKRGLRVAIPVLEDIPDPQVKEADPVGLVVLSKTTGRNPRGQVVDRLAAQVHFRYGAALTSPGDERRNVFAQQDGALFQYPRRMAKESALLRQLEATGLKPLGPLPVYQRQPQARWVKDPDGTPLTRAAMELMVALRGRGFDVELGGDLGVQVLVDSAKATYADIEDQGGPFIGVDTGVLVDGTRLPLAEIAHAALSSPDFLVEPSADAIPGESERQLYVPLDDTRVVSLPHSRVRELLAPFLEWVQSQKADAGGKRPARLKLPRAALLSMAFDPESDQATWLALPGAEHLRDSVRALREASHRDVPVTPEGFVGELREYQREGVRWLNTLAELGLGGLLGDEMGLGKTVQLLAAILMRRQRHQEAPVLVIAPKQVVDGGWMQKAHFVPGLRILNLTGPDRAARVDQIPASDIVLCNYNTMRQDIETLLEHEWSMVVFDESQYMKNMTSVSHNCARQLQAQAKRVMVVSGTPLENHVGELHAQMALCTPGLLGDSREFNKFYRHPIERRGDTDALSRLRRRLGPFILRRKKEDVLKDLPPKTEILRQVSLAPEQQALYDQHKLAASKKVWEALHTRGLANAQITVLDQLQRLQMICCHPRLNRGAPGLGESAKVEHILEIVDDVLDRSRRLVIVSQYVSFLKLIGEELRKRGHAYYEIYGSSRDRLEAQNAFQRGERPIMLLSLKAGGVGLDLTAADNVIVASPWWNPQAENQAIDRTHRIGQVNPVFAYRVVCENTIEVEVLSRQAKKLALAASVLDGEASAGEAILTLDDVVALFGDDPTGRARDVDTTLSSDAAPPVYPDLPEDDGELEEALVDLEPTPAPRPSPVESKPTPAPAPSAAGEALTRQDLVIWMRDTMAAQGMTVPQVAKHLGREPTWLYNRVSLNASTRIPPADLMSLASYCSAVVPPELLTLCEREWSGNRA